MRQSQLFTKTIREAPKDEVSINAQLLIRAGCIHKEMAGAYVLLPLGLRVVEKIKQIVREEMNGIGANELLMTTLQRKELWEHTDRWDDEKVDVWFKSALKNETPIGLAWSHEEPITDMMKAFVHSYRDLPAYVYQFQTKLRNELRAKSGIMRGREFIMKDMYSYCPSEKAHQAFYKSATAAYLRVFERLGIGEHTFLTFASGGAFTQFSHEFQTLTDAGEDIIYLDREKKLAINKEVYTDELIAQLGVSKENIEEVKAAEVGNIFSFGTKKSEEIGLTFAAEDGTMNLPFLGSYGIGITRLMGVIAEKFSDEAGLVWPLAIAPYSVHLVSLSREEAYIVQADKLYNDLKEAGIEVLYDDREDTRAGQKFADSDLLGIPLRIVVSPKTLEDNNVEVKKRAETNHTFVSLSALVSSVKALLA